jgi:hypothetical protein
VKDHYVSQTYLSGFANDKGFLVPYYKTEHNVVGNQVVPKSVCYEIDGDLNKFLDDPRVLDSYLPQFENYWVANVQTLRRHLIDDISKYQMAGYVAYLRASTPTAKRLGQANLKAVTEPEMQETAKKLFEQSPPEDDETRAIIAKLIDEKKLHVNIDRQYPHALSITSLLQSTARHFYGKWLIMINKSVVPFITSDNPAVAYYHGGDYSRADIFVPAAPDIALLIHADTDDKPIRLPQQRGVSMGMEQFAEPKPEYVELFNELIIKAAEKRVFSSSREKWIEEKVRAFRNWRMETVIDRIEVPGGMTIVSRQLVQESRGA